MKQCFILLVIMLTLAHNGFAAINVVSAKVVDAENQEPIYSAAVKVKYTFYGTITDAYGSFGLHLPPAYDANDSILITCLGYHDTTFSIGSILPSLHSEWEAPKYIQLRKKVYSLPDIEVKAREAEEVIEKAIAAIPDNYDQDPHLQTAYYRQAHEENSKFVRLIEAELGIYYEAVGGKNSNTLAEKIRVNQIRRSLVYERNGDKHGDHMVELIMEDPVNYQVGNILNPKSIESFEWHYADTLPLAGFEPWEYSCIYFRNKTWNEEKNVEGYVFINRADYAILRIDINRWPNPYWPNQPSWFDKWVFNNGYLKFIYTKKEGKYYLEQAIWAYNHYVRNDQTRQTQYIVEETFELYLDKVQTENLPQPDKANGFQNSGGLYSIKYSYDPTLWEAHPLVKKYIPNASIWHDLEKYTDLELQFKIAGENP